MSLASYGHVTCLIMVYVPCLFSHSSGDLMVINQHHHYCASHDITLCPHQLLLEDLCSQLTEWRQAREWLIIFLDTNENMLHGPFHDMLSSPDLQMQEATFHFHLDPCWHNMATFQKGLALGIWPIDSMWVTPDLLIEPPLGKNSFPTW
jgi:hypothetical protein